jgi:Putative transposase/Transposase zinc-binding domain
VPAPAHRARGTVRVELADIVREHAPALLASARLARVQRRALRAIERCRTAALGGQISQCDHCGAARYVYHSYRNRHCPKCQTLAKERWLAARRAELLPVPYFHLVLTLPHELNALAQGNPRAIYTMLFAAASQTLLEFGANPRWLGGQIAACLVLHTWGQTLTQHLHVHALLAGGALGFDGRWISPRRGFLFPVKALSKVFRAKFLAALSGAFAKDELRLAGATAALAEPTARGTFLAALRAKPWVVYAKHTLADPEQVLDYLGRYVQRVAITNERLLALEQGSVRFAWRDRAHANQRKTMRLPASEFLDRFLLHVLPSGFMRIRHYGLLANRHKHEHLAQVRAALNHPAPPPTPTESVHAFCLRVLGIDIERCPTCRIGTVRPIGTPAPQLSPRPRPP